MLPRSQRLSGDQLNLVMEKGRVTHSSLFWLRSLKYDGQTKVAAIAPQKIVKTAVGRVKVRRQIYNTLGLIYSLITHSHLVLVCAKEPALKATPTDFVKEIRDIFVKSGLLK